MAKLAGEAGRCPRARAMRTQKRGEVAQMAPTAGGAREGERHVLQQEVAGHAGKARRGKQAAVTRIRQAQAVRPQAAEGGKAQNEPDDENPQRREAGGEQHLGGDEGGAPDEDGEQCECMRFHGRTCSGDESTEPLGVEGDNGAPLARSAPTLDSVTAR